MPLLDHPLEKIHSFNNKYVHGPNGHNPDAQDFMLTRGMGEFSALAQITFEKHLGDLKRQKIGLTHRMAI